MPLCAAAADAELGPVTAEEEAALVELVPTEVLFVALALVLLAAAAAAVVVTNGAALIVLSESFAASKFCCGHAAVAFAQALDEQHPMKGFLSPAPLHVYQLPAPAPAHACVLTSA